MDLLTILTILAAIATIAVGIGGALRYLEEEPQKAKRVLSISAGIVVVVLITALIVSQARGTAGVLQLGGTTSARTSPTATDTPTDTPTPTVTPAPLPTSSPTPKPAPGAVLYSADWSNGSNGWALSSDWKVLNSVLLNDGTGGLSGPSAMPPYVPGQADYAIQARVTIDQDPSRGGALDFQANVMEWVRDNNGRGYCFRVGSGSQAGSSICKDNKFNHIADASFRTTTGQTHTYRLEVHGNQLRALVDGGVILQGSDNSYLSPGQVGLAVEGFQLEVSSFQVIAL